MNNAIHSVRISFTLAPVLLVVAGCATHHGRHAHSGFFPASGGKLYYEVQGEGSPVVLIHGGQMDHRIWDEQVALLAQDRRVVGYDIRGFGSSPARNRFYAHYEELAGLLDHLEIERADLVGLSLGGEIAIDFAIAYPDRVRRLVAVAPALSGFDWSPDFGQGFVAVVEALQDGDEEKAVELWMTDPMMQPANENPTVGPVIRRIVRENIGCWLVNPNYEKALRPRAAKRLGEVKAPTLVIIGDRDAPDLKRVCDKLVQEVTGARKVVILGAGHIVNMERPHEFNRALLDFIRP